MNEYTPRPEEIAAVLSLAASEKVEYTIKRIVDWEVAYGLYDNGWAMAADSTGAECFLIWPARAFAELARIDEWQGFAVTPIQLDEISNKLLPDLKKTQTKIGILFDGSKTGVIVSPIELKEMISMEESNY